MASKHLIDQVNHIVNTLENPPMVLVEDPTRTAEDAGWTYDEDEETWKDAQGSELYDDSVRPMSAFDYLSDALDIEYRVNGSKEYLGAEILVCFGGPNVWINTKSNTVVGRWWGEHFESTYEDNIGIDNACEELFRC